jgi:hypothetical protein
MVYSNLRTRYLSLESVAWIHPASGVYITPTMSTKNESTTGASRDVNLYRVRLFYVDPNLLLSSFSFLASNGPPRHQFDPDDADLDLGLPVSNTDEFRCEMPQLM